MAALTNAQWQRRYQERHKKGDLFPPKDNDFPSAQDAPAGAVAALVPASTSPDFSCLVRYSTMVKAIAECCRVDEVKDVHDKTLALELYARQVKNVEAERQAAEIRLRAERRMGELIRAMQQAGELQTRGGDRKSNSSQGSLISGAAEEGEKSNFADPSLISEPQSLSDFGISHYQSHQYQRLADIPPADFDLALADPAVKPAAARILREAKARAQIVQEVASVPPQDPGVLWLWGRVRDFERLGLLRRDPVEIHTALEQTQRQDLARLLPEVVSLLSGLHLAGSACPVYASPLPMVVDPSDSVRCRFFRDPGSYALAGCPFCGGSPVLLSSMPGVGLWFVECSGCEGRSSVAVDPLAAVAAWNRRAAPAQSPEAAP